MKNRPLSCVWQKVLNLCDIHRAAADWTNGFQWAKLRLKLKGKRPYCIILRLAWSACIYFIWRERNNRLFGWQQLSQEGVLLKIMEVIRYKL